ncbi:MAG: ROK family protein [Anaerolineales bacterium]|nr:ROK family protein [Anaerolineales bacterium]
MAKKLFIGVDLGGTSIRAGVVDSKGNVLALEKRKTHPELGVEGVFERLTGAIERALKTAELKPKNVAGIGVGVPGPVDPEKGIVRVAVNLGKGWNNMPLADRLKEHFGAKAFVNNDVRVGALGEHRHGAGQGVQDMVAIFVGTGIGGGIILGGELRGGFRGGAGEVGHTIFDMSNGVIDPANGQPGAIEPIAARNGMQKAILARVAAGEPSVVPQLIEEIGQGRLTSRTIDEALKRKDKVMLEVLTQSQNALGVLAGNLINILDPEVIVIGGGVTERMGDKFVAPIRKLAYAHSVNKMDINRVKIVPAALKDASGVVGAAVLAREGV